MRPTRSLPPFLLLSPHPEYRCDEHGRGVHLKREGQLVVGPVGNVHEEGDAVRDVGPMLVGEAGRKVGGKGDLKLSWGGRKE